MPVPVISYTQAFRYGFSQVQAWVAQKNPRATRAEHYILLFAIPLLAAHGALRELLLGPRRG